MASTVDLAQQIASGQRSFSFEFFPPKTDAGEERLWQTLRELEGLRPTFASVTYGAGGSTRDRTVRLTARMAAETTLTPVAHLTCVGASVDQIRGVVAQYADAGVTNVLALRGDPADGPSSPWQSTPGGLDHADQLVELLRSWGDFNVGVAAFPEGHPTSIDRDADARVLARKADAGASFAITQFFFQASDYFDLVARAQRHGCAIPIIPGIMPVTNISQLKRFVELSGASFPADLRAAFEQAAADPDQVVKLGVEVATQLCQQLLDEGAPGLHFYTLNSSLATRQIYERLSLSMSPSG